MIMIENVWIFDRRVRVRLIKPALTSEQTKSIKPKKNSSLQLVPYSPTNDEVVHSKRLGRG